MTKMEHALRYLIAVEKKNKGFFKEHNLKIADCVDLTNNGNTVNVAIINKSLPASIKDDIKAMFWL
ncbi:hypothetical protein [Mucilaginibacter phyllosphaerae]|uniref:Uncharacterized protein n=1 Tax=Mucilaginibacter phyllosphaerae TaxID=1812349 RepID=A0A4Y8A9N5_9SPHI|nr:hypothetical protein [Mucilaginibacter phyllosphaerae]MBB3969755.1 hypothetical protein [Mucilaginibacter phyllosphaerae]TEW65136.1 hypothetical protein E2R65_14570 [Mucilaginibacter phyllosphaerae]GGH17737.1 hypothetical protein GCM10007352_28040 [Mucilaginibacter phyllosphaerae]